MNVEIIKPKKHLLILEVSHMLESGHAEDIVKQLQNAIPELNVLVTMPNTTLTLITLEDQQK